MGLFEPVTNQAAQLGIVFCTDWFLLSPQQEIYLLEGPVKDTLVIEISISIKWDSNPRTWEIFLTRHVIYRCATTTANPLGSKLVGQVLPLG